MPEEKTTGIDRDGARTAAPLPVYSEERLYLDSEIHELQRMVVFFAGVTAGLVLALHLILKQRS